MTSLIGGGLRAKPVTTVSPRAALGYALGREMLPLYGVIAAGYVAVILAGWFGSTWAVRGGGAGVVGGVLAAVSLLAGVVAILGGVVGLAYKVIADATHAPRS